MLFTNWTGVLCRMFYSVYIKIESRGTGWVHTDKGTESDEEIEILVDTGVHHLCYIVVGQKKRQVIEIDRKLMPS